ncbi:hypothetical protein EJ06DRAFT_526560 [Trichodelitschia bisporula]|uniref:Uncharacterized protein n=1 Tax=Trichodelitschia bisporula TaxID=703511 RepID=A0A6G1I890_9PEZI|nr:hypothetical protein EJ06DRAFT_526560 [Trichodelitschia bisporula]
MRRIVDFDNDPELKEASWEAARGAASGAATWGLIAAVAGGVGYAYSPIYRGLTPQFKVFLQFSAMTFGGMVEADKRMRAHEVLVRHRKRFERNQAELRSYEDEFEAKGTPGVGSEGAVGRDMGDLGK